ncbi:unnamed protein product, partial [Vitis vinifera]
MATEPSADSYVGSFITLISKCEIRYEGVLYFLNAQDSTIGLKNVRSYGTEGRKKDGTQIPPSDKVYEFILFRGSDIKDLQVKSTPPAQKEDQIHDDPAIIQSHCSGGLSSSLASASVGGGALTESSGYQDAPALVHRAYPGALPSYQSGMPVGPLGQPQTTQIAGVPSHAMSMYWQGYNETSISTSHAPQQPSPQATSTTSFPSALPNELQAPEIQASPSEQFSTSSDTMSFLSAKATLPSYSAPVNSNIINMSSFPSSYQDVNTTEAPITGKIVSDLVSVPPIHPLHHSASTIGGSTSGLLLTPPPTLLTPDQLAQPMSSMLSSSQKVYPDQRDKVAPTSTSPNTLSTMSTPALQAPLLPLPASAQQSQKSAVQFTEEFDFIAMNERFKKDEVWGYLGKAKQRDEKEGMEDNALGQGLGDREGYGQVPKSDAKPAYNKDEFFDTISCNSHARGTRNGQNRFSARMKMDTETFGNFQQRPHLGYGGYRAGRGENYRGSYNRGRGFAYGGRGGGWDMPM